MEKREIYLDNSATTRVFPEVVRLMDTIYLDEYGNPSSMHHKGVEAERHIREAKKTFADILKCTPQNIYFTSCGTESDNISLIGAARANLRSGKHLITTAIEHPAILETMKYLESEGFEVTILPVDHNGRVDPEAVYDAVREDTILVSVMHTNNEIGALEPIAEIGRRIKEKNPNTLFHVDAVQGFGKAKIYPKRMGIDLLSFSGHKIHGPKGIGFLYVNEKVKIRPILFGGGQQGGMRSGTENVPGIAGMGKAVEEIYRNIDEDIDRMYDLKEYFVKGVSALPEVRVNGLTGRDSAPHVVSVSVRGIRAEVLLHELESHGIYISAGSACSAHKPTPSATLQAIGVEKELLDSTVRFSFSVFTTKEELDYCLEVLSECIPRLRRYTRR